MKKWSGFFIVVDTETGGIPSSLKKEPTTEVALCEVAMTIVDSVSLKIVDSKSWIIKPYNDKLIYTEDSAKITGLDRKKCENVGEEAAVVATNIKNIAEKYKRDSYKPIIVGHNVGFDIPFIVNFLKIFNSSSGQYHSLFSEEYEDTLKYAIYAKPNLPNHKLITVAQEYNIELVNSHRAEKDTRVTAKLFIEFIKNLRNTVCSQVETKESDFKLKYQVK